MTDAACTRSRPCASTRSLRLAVGLVLAALLALPALPSQAQSFEERALEQARQRVESVERRLDAARGQASQAAGRLEQLQQDVEQLEAAVNAAADAVAQQEAEVARAAQRLDDLRADTERLEQALTVQVVELFKRGSALRLETILGAGDVSSAIQRAEFVHVLAAGEKALLERLDNSRVLVEAQRQRFDAQRERLLAFMQEQDALLVRATAARDEARSVLAAARSSVVSLERQQDDLERDAKELKELIERNSAAPTSGLSPSTAGYIWPICGRVTSEFGRRWGRRHEGIDIDGDTGDVIAASKAGVVIYAAWQGGYGNLTLIDHGDGVVTAYAHQSAFLVGRGDSVARGQKIGKVGNTGRSTGPHLHFETRVNGNAENPRRFLNRGC